MSSQETAPAARPPKDDIGLRIAHWCSIVYIFSYGVESPIRYALHLVHLGPIILIHDGLIVAPLLFLGFRDLLQRRLHPAFWIFGCVVAIAGTVSELHFGTPRPALIGTKILLNVLFGVVAGSMLVRLPSRRLCQCMFALWVVTVLALVAEKYFISFPWVGMRETINGVAVELARDWQIGDPGSKRVGGLTHSSIDAAVLVCSLCITIMFRIRQPLIRIGMIIVTTGAVYLTTQKGAVVGFVLVSLVSLVPSAMRRPLLSLLLIVAVVFDIALPLYTTGLFMEQGQGGVFSGGSFAERIVETWPRTLDWIDKHETFPLGVGMGGIGAAQQSFDNAAQHMPDNIFLLTYSYFGLPSLLFFGLFIYAAVKSARIDPRIAEPGLAIAAFTLLYGIVVSIFEGQASSLYMSAALGVILSAPRLLDRSGASVSNRWGNRLPSQAGPPTLAKTNG